MADSLPSNMDNRIVLPSGDESTPDVTNGAAFKPAPPRRTDTMSSKPASEGNGDTCRICRSEGSAEEPLFYPCKCSGSIKFVHQECLMEWLSHSHKKHCELCKTPFRFTKLYDANMPQTLPWGVFLRRGLIHAGLTFIAASRWTLVGAVWMGILPWLVRWAWRWMMWAADAGWAREAFMHRMRSDFLTSQVERANATILTSDTFTNTFQHFLDIGNWLNGTLEEPLALTLAKDTFASLGLGNIFSGSSSGGSNDTLHDPFAMSWPQADSSILSSWTYLSQLTPNPTTNRVILDIFEGQLITCVVITGFILVFLIREWVVQQQPLVNPPAANNQARQAILDAETQRLRQEREASGEARRRVGELTSRSNALADKIVGEDYKGWEYVAELIDQTIEYARTGDRKEFVSRARQVVQQITATARSSDDMDQLVDSFRSKLATCTPQERRIWVEHSREIFEGMVCGELVGERKELPDHSNGPSGRPQAGSSEVHVKAGPSGQEWSSADFERRRKRLDRLITEVDETTRKEDISKLMMASIEMMIEETVTSEDSTRGASNPFMGFRNAVDEEALDDEDLPITNAGPDAKINIKRGRKIEGVRQKENKALEELEREIEKDDAEARSRAQGSDPSPSAFPSSQNGPVVPPAHADNPFRMDDTPAELPAVPSNVQFILDTLAIGDEAEERSIHDSELAELERLRDIGFAIESPEEDEDWEDDSVSGASISMHSSGTSDQASPVQPAEDLAPVISEFDPSPEQPLPLSPPEIEEAENDEDDEDGFETRPIPQPAPAPPGRLQRLADWFWGDIQPQQGIEAVPVADEERVGDENAGQEAPFAPFDMPLQPEVPILAAVFEDLGEHAHDPEVAAAAAQAGLDAEALDDAEDLEGILELLGLQGPLIGLVQTSTFCTVLVTGTVLGAVGLPYIWGKMVLSFIGSPVYFLLKMPLQISSFFADFAIDLAILVGGYCAIIALVAGDFLLSALEAWAPNLGGTKIMEWIMDLATAAASSSALRLKHAVLMSDGLGDFGWNWAFLKASVHAHASLKNLGEETDAVLNYIGSTITAIVETISSGSVSIVWQRTLNACARIPEIPARLLAGVDVTQYTKPFLKTVSGLRSGALTFSIPDSSLDPSLVYWSCSDRSLAVIAGYLAVAALAAVYVALDTPITSSQSGQKTEKKIRDTLRQAGGVFKVILIISIEMLVFPFYCGVLLDIAFLPLFQDVSVATRWAFAIKNPYLFSFMHWFVGTCYMFHFALFVGMCRKILRKGVLWFIRDPDDPTFHPVRDVLERNVTTQLRKIAFSALVYGALVILCLGGVIWTIGRLFPGIFPIHWISTEPVLEFPADLLLYNAITPFMVRFFRPSEAVSALYGWWLRRCARVLRLSHFLFDDVRKEEEGRHIRNSWVSLLLMRKGDVEEKQPQGTRLITATEDAATQKTPDVYFQRDGKYVLTPCNDLYRPPKPGEAFFHFVEDEMYIADDLGNKNNCFAIVYVPPHFRLRVTMFMVCLWIFSVIMGLGGTLVPLVFGRRILASFFITADAGQMNDIYAYSVGAYVLAGALAVIFQGRSFLQKAREQAHRFDFKGLARRITEPMGRYALRALKCAYVYGFAGVVLPTIFALVLQFYLILPLHTYSAASAVNNSSTLTNMTTADATLLAGNATMTHEPLIFPQPPTINALAHHTIHLLQDYCLGLLYIRLFTRLLSPTPRSRISEARRRIFAAGSFNPDVCLTTRVLVLPTLLFSAVLLLGPPAAAAFIPVSWLGGSVEKAVMYRYSFPVAAMAGVGALVVGKAISSMVRWQTRVRDEVYLVGERLHNYGEKRPPVGSRSVVRKDR